MLEQGQGRTAGVLSKKGWIKECVQRGLKGISALWHGSQHSRSSSYQQPSQQHVQPPALAELRAGVLSNSAPGIELFHLHWATQSHKNSVIFALWSTLLYRLAPSCHCTRPWASRPIIFKGKEELASTNNKTEWKWKVRKTVILSSLLYMAPWRGKKKKKSSSQACSIELKLMLS